MKKKVLIIENDKRVLEILAFALGREGYMIIRAGDALAGIQFAIEQSPDMIVLDVTSLPAEDVPAMDNCEVCRRLRESGITVPILVFVPSEDKKSTVLDAGADECIQTPFAMKELLSRVRVNTWHLDGPSIGRASTAKRKVLGRLVIYPDEAVILKDGAALDLSPREYDLICFLVAEPGKVFSREDLMRNVWEYTDYLGDVRAVDVTIRRLREKIEDDPARPTIIVTRRGHGYFLAV